MVRKVTKLYNINNYLGPPHQLNAYYVLYAFLSLTANPCPFSDKYSNCPQLKQQWGCNNPDVASWCPASCKCTNQII